MKRAYLVGGLLACFAGDVLAVPFMSYRDFSDGHARSGQSADNYQEVNLAGWVYDNPQESSSGVPYVNEGGILPGPMIGNSYLFTFGNEGPVLNMHFNGFLFGPGSWTVTGFDANGVEIMSRTESVSGEGWNKAFNQALVPRHLSQPMVPMTYVLLEFTVPVALDSILGVFDDEWKAANSVPDGGATAALLALGCLGLIGVRHVKAS